MTLDFRPDRDHATPGLITLMRDMIPTARGYKAWYKQTEHSAHTITLAANEVGITSLFASRWLSAPGGIVLAGTNKDIYLYNFATGFASVRHAAGAYDLSAAGTTASLFGEDATQAFDFCEFGDVVIVCHKSVATQTRSATDTSAATKFADLAAAPKASCCEVASNFVFLGDCASWDVVTGATNILAWSGIGDHTSWAVNPTVTQASYASFTDTPGGITAIKRLGDNLVVYKGSSMYLGRYVGPGTNSPIWDFVRVSDQIGCIGHRSVVDIGNAHVFVGPNDVYMFDGTRPRSITDGVFESVIRPGLRRTSSFPMWLGHDKPNQQVMFSSASASSATYTWNYRLNRWGQLYNSYFTSPEVWCKTNADNFSVVTQAVDGGLSQSTGHPNIYTMSGGLINLTTAGCANRNTTYSTIAQLVTGGYGQDEKVTMWSRLVPRWVTIPSSATCSMNIKDTIGANYTGNYSTTMDSKKRFDLLSNGAAATPWARFQLDWSGEGEIADISVSIYKPTGTK